LFERVSLYISRCTATERCRWAADFLEAVARIADGKSLPPTQELSAAGYSDILAWALDMERQEGNPDQSNNQSVAPIFRCVGHRCCCHQGLDIDGTFLDLLNIAPNGWTWPHAPRMTLQLV
jgi:hypothetical protein